MKIPKFKIFWECIASDYLELHDLAVFELACDAKSVRNELCLPRKRHRALSSSCNPYAVDLYLSPSRRILLRNMTMMIWCQKRRLRLPHVELGFELKSRSLSRHAQSTPSLFSQLLASLNCIDASPSEVDRDEGWDLFNHVESLHLTNWSFIFDNDELWTRLPRLQNFSSKAVVFLPSSMLALAQLPSQSSKYAYLTSLSLEGMSADALRLLFQNLSVSALTSLSLTKSSLDDPLLFIASKFNMLRSLELLRCNCFSDRGLEFLAESRAVLRRLRVMNCHKVTAHGIRKLLAYSYAHIEELGLCSITEGDLIEILRHCRSLRSLELTSSIILTMRYGAELLDRIAQHHRALRALSLDVLMVAEVTPRCYCQLIESCQQLERFAVVYGIAFDRDTSSFIAAKLSDCLREIILPSHLMTINDTSSIYTEVFADCRHRVRIQVSVRGRFFNIQ
jgi:hypothetical protein